jgi:hypothetical protein
MKVGRVACALAAIGVSAVGLTVGEFGANTSVYPVTHSAPAVVPQDVRTAGYNQAVVDLRRRFWTEERDPAHPSPPHILPTQGDGGPNHGLVDRRAWPTFWQMSQYAKFLVGDWRFTRSEKAKERIASNWAFVQQTWTPQQLAGDGKADSSVTASDDAAWKANYLAQVHEVTGDARALRYLEEMIPATLARFADPNQPRIMLGRSPAGRPIASSRFGMLYVAADNVEGTKTYGVVSSLYEVMFAHAALYVYEQTDNPAYLQYARRTYDWTRAQLRNVKENDADTATGVYLTALLLDPKSFVNGMPAAENRYFGKPIRGLSAEYSGGTLAMAVLAARLYRVAHDPAYLGEARSIAAAFVRTDAFGRRRGADRLFVNERDPWTEGYWYPDFVTSVLPLPGVDPSGAFKAALISTARAIVLQRSPDGLYGADWSGPELNINTHLYSWTAESAQANGGKGGGPATPAQIMTSANSAMVVQAATMMDTDSP